MADKKYICYLASPFFNEEQKARELKIRNLLKSFEYLDVYAPIEKGILTPNAEEDIRDMIFKENVRALNECDMVFCITNGKDVGSIWEAGVAYGLGKHIVYFCEGLDGNFNIMLAKSGNAVYTSFDDIDVTEIYEILKYDRKIKYEGKVE